MRTAGTFEAETLPEYNRVTGGGGWVPIYVLGGLAAMLGLIGFALVILACSYWKLSDHSAASTEGKAVHGGMSDKGGQVLVNSVVVIMAGDQTPTFLATLTPKASGDEDSLTQKHVVVQLPASVGTTTM